MLKKLLNHSRPFAVFILGMVCSISLFSPPVWSQTNETVENFIEKYDQELSQPPASALDGDLSETYYEDLVLAVYVNRTRLSAGIFAVQKDNRYYLPIQELASLLGIYIDVDEETRRIEGWSIEKDRNFVVDPANHLISYRGNSAKLPEEAILEEEYAGDDIYVLSDVISQIWPLTLDVELSSLLLRITPDEKLPFELFLDRKNRQERLRDRQANTEEDDVLYPFVAKPYQLLGKPSLDMEVAAGFDALTDSPQYKTSVTGVQDLLYASADYSAAFSHRDGQLDKPENIRLRFRRQNIHEGALPFGLEDTQWGDVNLGNRDLISSGLNGRGFIFSTKRDNFRNEFDLVTIDGIATPGWEAELYRNDQLIDFSVVDERGEYRFEDVSIGYGNNQIRVVLYGPQGEIEERVENYFYRSNVVKEGENVFIGGIVDSQKDLIPFDERDRKARAEGLAANIYAARGLTKKLTAFATANTLNDFDDGRKGEERRNYVSAGAIASVGTTLAQIEAYKQLGAGQAVDVKTASDFFGFKVNSQLSFFSDFESPDARRGDNAKKRELDLNVRKTFPTYFGNLGLEAGAEHTERQNGINNTVYRTRQSMAIRSTRVSNTTRTNLSNGNHTTTTGNITSTTRRNKWLFRNRIGYDVFPELDLSDIQFDLRYRKNKDFSGAVSLAKNFNSQEVRLGLQLTRDFQKYRASFETDWSSNNGLSFLVRASTAIGPYAQDGSYLMTSDPLASSGPVGSFVFLDKDYDGVFGEGDEPMPDTKIQIGRRITKEETDENGYLAEINTTSGRVVNTSVAARSIDDPYLVPSVPGYSLYPRPGVIHRLELPLIETGAIDGTLYYTNGESVPGLNLQLVDDAGNIIQESQTGADGYFTFERIPPGTYIIRADPASGFDFPSKQVVLAPDDLFQFGVDIQITGLDNSVPMVPAPDVQSDGTLSAKNILSLVKGAKAKAAPRQPEVEVQTAPEPSASAVPVEEPIESLQTLEPAAGVTDLPTSVHGFRFGNHPDKTRMVMDLSGPVTYTIKYDEAGNTLLIDMPQTAWSVQDDDVIKSGKFISAYRVEQLPESGTRVILKMADNTSVGNSGLLKAHAGKKDRLYLDVLKK